MHKFVWNVSNFNLIFNERASSKLNHQKKWRTERFGISKTSLLLLNASKMKWNDLTWNEKQNLLIKCLALSCCLKLSNENCMRVYDKHKFTYFEYRVIVHVYMGLIMCCRAGETFTTKVQTKTLLLKLVSIKV